MRVVGGSARGVPLVGPSSPGTRPISDRAKESLFNILAPRLDAARFLDVFAGTGGVGIEALSRGAAHATFVELDRRAIADIDANLAKTRLGDQATVVRGDALALLAAGPDGPAYDVVFVAPPQWRELLVPALRALDDQPGWVAPGGLVVTQCDPTEDVPSELRHFAPVRTATYGNVLLTFFEPVS